MGKAKFAYTIWQWGTENKEQFTQAGKDISGVGFKYFESVKTTINAFNGDVSEFMNLCNQYGVKPIGFYFHLTGERENDVEDAKRKMPFIAKAGIKTINVQATGVQGRPANEEELQYDLKAINTIADIAGQYGIFPCLHPHHNTTVMYENEIDFIMQNTDPGRIAFGPDTAHLKAGNCDPVKVIKKYAERVKFIHLKDITNEGVKAAGMQAGVEVYSNFRELGEGIVDFPAVFKVLDDVGYDGYLTAELDMSRFGNKKSAEISLKYLREHYKQDA